MLKTKPLTLALALALPYAQAEWTVLFDSGFEGDQIVTAKYVQSSTTTIAINGSNNKNGEVLATYTLAARPVILTNANGDEDRFCLQKDNGLSRDGSTFVFQVNKSNNNNFQLITETNGTAENIVGIKSLFSPCQTNGASTGRTLIAAIVKQGTLTPLNGLKMAQVGDTNQVQLTIDGSYPQGNTDQTVKATLIIKDEAQQLFFTKDINISVAKQPFATFTGFTSAPNQSKTVSVNQESSSVVFEFNDNFDTSKNATLPPRSYTVSGNLSNHFEVNQVGSDSSTGGKWQLRYKYSAAAKTALTTLVGSASDATLNLSISSTSTDSQSIAVKVLKSTFIKLDANGKVLADSATSWDCVKDTKTGLIWEGKKGTPYPGDIDNWSPYNHEEIWTHNVNSRFMYYDAEKGIGRIIGGTCPHALNANSECNTSAYVSRINGENFCGQSNWQLPDYSQLNGLKKDLFTAGTLDTTYFPKLASGTHWTKNTAPNRTSTFLTVDFSTASETPTSANYAIVQFLRLVAPTQGQSD